MASVGIEANPLAQFAAAAKVDWSPDPSRLVRHAEKIARAARSQLDCDGGRDDPSAGEVGLFAGPGRESGEQPAHLRTLSPGKVKLLLRDSISPVPLHKT